MRFFKSIRWRFQLWYGLLFATMLCGFGFTAWEMERASRFQEIDRELNQRVSLLTAALRPPGPPRNGPPGGPGALRQGPEGREGLEGTGPPRDRPSPLERELYGPGPEGPGPPERDGLPDDPSPFRPPPGARLARRLGPPEAGLYNQTGKGNLYYVIWLHNGPAFTRSPGAPEDIPQPQKDAAEPRQRGSYREAFFFPAPADCVLVGRSIETDLASLRRLAWLFGAVGAGVLALGLAGGWWLTSHALRPIEDISSAATNIANGDLSQRINTSQTQSELGELASVLNATFSRLDANFKQQARFTSDAAHELRTPVTVLLTQTQSALVRDRSPEEYRDTLEACQRAAQRMRRLTESLLELARLDSGHEPMRRANFDLSVVVEDCLDLVRPLAEQRNISLHDDLPKTPCSGDPERIAQVITNLAANAIHHNRDGGEVRVSLRAEEDEVLLVVADTGSGIKTEDMPHIFERFYRADKARTTTQERTGLGLAISKAIIEAHHGSLEVFSEEGQGSAFTVRLPVGPGTSNGVPR